MIPSATHTDHTDSTTMDVSDAERELTARIRAGDSQAFEELVRQFGGRMRAVAKRMLGNEHDANDAVQDALISVFRKAHTFQSNSKLSTWLHRVTVNACLMKLRSQRRRGETPIEEILPMFDDAGHQTGKTAWEEPTCKGLEQAELRQEVRNCISRLPEQYQTVLLLRDIEERCTQEVADMWRVSMACVKTRLHRARQALRTLLAPMFEQEFA